MSRTSPLRDNSKLGQSAMKKSMVANLVKRGIGKETTQNKAPKTINVGVDVAPPKTNKKNNLQYILGGLVLVLLLVGSGAGYLLMQTSQDVRQQASVTPYCSNTMKGLCEANGQTCSDTLDGGECTGGNNTDDGNNDNNTGSNDTCSTWSVTCETASHGTVTHTESSCATQALFNNSESAWASEACTYDIPSSDNGNTNDGTSGVGGTDGSDPNATGSVTPNDQDAQARGACPYVVTCNCSNGVTKQHCTYGNIYSSTNVIPHCQNEVCPSVGSASSNGQTKICEPGNISCTSGDKGKICNMSGTGYYDGEVSAHACGATHTTVYRYCTDATNTNCYDSSEECRTANGGNHCQIATTSDTINQVINPDGTTPAGTRFFVGCCGTDGTSNAYKVSDGNGNLTDSCVYEQGLSCGAQITDGQEPPPSGEEPPNEEPPEETPPPESTPSPPPSNPPVGYYCNSSCDSTIQCQTADSRFICSAEEGNRCRLEDNPTSPNCQPAIGPMCLDISILDTETGFAITTDPTINQTVKFTCAEVAGADHYIFRVVHQDGTIDNLAATGRTSENYTISKSGQYWAQCQICENSSDASCHPYEAL